MPRMCPSQCVTIQGNFEKIFLNSLFTFAYLRLVYSYVYECTSPNYYPPGCSVYCVPRQTSDTCYNCSATGSKICCSGFSGSIVPLIMW